MPTSSAPWLPSTWLPSTLAPGLALALALGLGGACAAAPTSPSPGEPAAASASSASAAASSAAHGDAKADPRAVFGQATPAPEAGTAVAIFSGGCFWCMEKPFDHVEGVLATTSGYIGGPELAPSYGQVSSHATGHAESLRVLYDPRKLSYERLLDVFWHNVDPTQAEGQFCDHGHQYRSAIWPGTLQEKALAQASKQAVEVRLGQPIVTEIDDVQAFWPAEDYHQDFSTKDPQRYTSYRAGCGRDRRLQQLWGEGAVYGEGQDWVVQAALKAGLTPDGDPAGKSSAP